MWHFLSQSKPVLESQNPRIIERQSGRICRLVGQGELQPSHLAKKMRKRGCDDANILMTTMKTTRCFDY